MAKYHSGLGTLRLLSGYSRLIILLAGFLIFSLRIFARHQISYDYNRTIEEASRETMNLAIAFEEQVRRIIADADKELLLLKQGYERDGISSPLIAAYTESVGNNLANNQVACRQRAGNRS